VGAAETWMEDSGTDMIHTSGERGRKIDYSVATHTHIQLKCTVSHSGMQCDQVGPLAFVANPLRDSSPLILFSALGHRAHPSSTSHAIMIVTGDLAKIGQEIPAVAALAALSFEVLHDEGNINMHERKCIGIVFRTLSSVHDLRPPLPIVRDKRERAASGISSMAMSCGDSHHVS